MHATATSYGNRLASQPTRPQIKKVDRLCRRLEAAGALAAFAAIYPLGACVAAADIPKDLLGRWNGSANGGPTLVTGLQVNFDGTDDWLNTGYTIAGDSSADLASLGLLVGVSDTVSQSSVAMGAFGGGNSFLLRPINGNVAQTTINAAAAFNLTYATASGSYLGQRIDASNVAFAKNGDHAVGLQTQAAAATSVVGAGRLGNAGTLWRGSLYLAGIINKPLTDPQRVAVNNASLLFASELGHDTDVWQELDAVQAPHYFPRTSPSFYVMQVAPPPATDAIDKSTYPHFPLSAAVSQQIPALISSTSTDFDGGAFLWLSRVRGYNNKPNIVCGIPIKLNGVECRTEFSNLTRATQADRIMQAYLLGADHIALANSLGFPTNDIIPYADALANPGAYFTNASIDGRGYRVTIDRVVLPVAQLPSGRKGKLIVYDYEVQDRRDPVPTKAHLLAMAQDAYAWGRDPWLYTNPLNTGAQNSGLNKDNLRDIALAFAKLSLLTWVRAAENDVIASLNVQKDLLRGPNDNQDIPWDHVFLTIGIGPSANTMSVADAQRVRAFRDTYNVPICVWRASGVPGGDGSVTYPADPTRNFNKALKALIGA